LSVAAPSAATLKFDVMSVLDLAVSLVVGAAFWKIDRAALPSPPPRPGKIARRRPPAPPAPES